MLERMKSESVIDIFGLVNQLRMQRNSMIETQDEYTFIYTALLESITDCNTEFRQHISTCFYFLLSCSTGLTITYNLSSLPPPPIQHTISSMSPSH
ncbi:unnamed protein product [Trichobilharzia regenti]|nr:unnamed protein product [Trichobilharzia regenti]